MWHIPHMDQPVIFRCPKTGVKVQHYIAEAVEPRETTEPYQAVFCPACSGLHFVMPSTGKLLGSRPRPGKE